MPPSATCSGCGIDFAAAEPCCPACGSGDRNVTLTDAVLGFESSLAIKARHGQPGQVRPFREMSDMVLWNHDRQCEARRRMVADAETDSYVQEWTSLDTGEVLFRKEGRLSDPDIHGKSARPRR